MSQSAVTRAGDISPLDTFMRRLLRLPAGADPNATAEKAFGTSILISTVRCLLTYVLLVHRHGTCRTLML